MKRKTLYSSLITLTLLILSTLSYIAFSGLAISIIPISLLLLILWRRHWKRNHQAKVAIIRGILSAVLAFASIIYLLQYRLPSGDYAHSMKVLSYNLYFRNTEYKTTIKWLLAQDADILALQEVTPRWGQELQTALSSRYPYAKVLPLKGTHGLAFFSKFPIQQDGIENNAYHLPIAQRIVVATNAGDFTFMNAHTASPAGAVEGSWHKLPITLERNARLRAQQWDQLRLHEGERTIIMGDLNTHRWERLYHHMRVHYQEAHAAAGSGFGLTFPNTHKLPYPVFRLDHILLRGPMTVEAAEVHYSGNSDHFPISATIRY